jgi:UDP-glucuronate decarboxylase
MPSKSALRDPDAAIRIVHRPLPQDDPRRRRPDITKANETLRWAPQTSLRDGLARTIDYFEKMLKEESIRPFLAQQGV